MQDDGDFSKDSGERDEARLAELGRAAVHMYILAHIFLEKLQVRDPLVVLVGTTLAPAPCVC